MTKFTDWLKAIPDLTPINELGPLQLAWLGDAVWELHQRLQLCQTPCCSKDLHSAVVKRVKATAQSSALQKLKPLLEKDELDLIRRGRNRAKRGPRNIDPAIYARATGFETMMGWLFLQNPARLVQLLDQLEETFP
uniref:RNase III domain-containing protein n=1 Tax=Paulinella chromatophora TaxID=39717 RepID=B1X410_PAUCH|nr:hypothetical protein PCC_0230 [Paulinella chromatophora]ACB42679.1 hypothetical protein PCC_0230 [Paulinella chromatophora]